MALGWRAVIAFDATCRAVSAVVAPCGAIIKGDQPPKRADQLNERHCVAFRKRWWLKPGSCARSKSSDDALRNEIDHQVIAIIVRVDMRRFDRVRDDLKVSAAHVTIRPSARYRTRSGTSQLLVTASSAMAAVFDGKDVIDMRKASRCRSARTMRLPGNPDGGYPRGRSPLFISWLATQSPAMSPQRPRRIWFRF
jgi:hypothetical protein